MAAETSIGERLLALKERASLSLAEIARLADYQGASSIQKLFKTNYRPDKLHPSVAEKLSKALVGRGDPPIERSELIALSGEGDLIDSFVADVRHYNYRASAFIAAYRTRRLADVVHTRGGHEIPLFVRHASSERVPYYDCPPHLRPLQIEGMYVTVGNMWPRYEEGEVIFYDNVRPAVVGDDVVVRIISESDLDGGMIIGRLHLLHEEEVQIDILTPADRLIFSRSMVISVHRLLHPSDLLGPVSYAEFR